MANKENNQNPLIGFLHKIRTKYYSSSTSARYFWILLFFILFALPPGSSNTQHNVGYLILGLLLFTSGIITIDRKEYQIGPFITSGTMAIIQGSMEVILGIMFFVYSLTKLFVN